MADAFVAAASGWIVMTLGLYSKIARRGIGEAQQRIAQWGYGASADDIRCCRQDLLDMERSKARTSRSRTLSDFFGVSSCRDLLFHVQEQQMRLPAIAEFLRGNDLTFLGFEIGDTTLQAYRRQFCRRPGSHQPSELAHTFESDNPDTFSGACIGSGFKNRASCERRTGGLMNAPIQLILDIDLCLAQNIVDNDRCLEKVELG